MLALVALATICFASFIERIDALLLVKSRRPSTTRVGTLYMSSWNDRKQNIFDTPEIDIKCEKDDFRQQSLAEKAKMVLATGMMMLTMGSPLGTLSSAYADDELAKYAAEGNTVAVDGECFIKKCALETSSCANDPSCLKGLSCLARCKGGSMCSTGCFSKYGSKTLDDLLYCSVEKNDCVQVPGKGDNSGWISDTRDTLPTTPLANYDISQLEGNWFKVMGLDSRYDCFDCQQNTFGFLKDKKSLSMDAWFRIPRPTNPGYLQSRISETLHIPDHETNPLVTLQSTGKMFGLTFWENWYVLGESQVGLKLPQEQFGVSSAYADVPDMISKRGVMDELKLIFYTGHTLQGSYKGAFLYSKSPSLSPEATRSAARLIYKSGLNPNDFCVIRNACFVKNETPQTKHNRGIFQASSDSSSDSTTGEWTASRRNAKNRQLYRMEQAVTKRGGSTGRTEDEKGPLWFLGSGFFKATSNIAEELSDWFEDPQILSEWLVQQQEHSIKTMPFAVSPFANLEPFDTYEDTKFDDSQALKGNPTVRGRREGDAKVMSDAERANFKKELTESQASIANY